ncbi:MAG: sulfotransferase domain-containing protein [Bacteroidales bacterium]|jgi:hypothetical protein|nr:sulfotransferase domain-containing protein [Bacteroidales bacterium]
MIKPNLFIIGASKCGTTSLWHMLNNHSEVFMSTPKEPWFFSFSNYNERLEWYLSLFKSAKHKKIIGEASPIYSETTLIPGIAERIYNFNSKAKVIYIVREPISRLKSVYSQTLSSGHWHKKIYENYTDIDVPIMPKKFERAIFEYPPFVEACKYWTHLNNYRNFFNDDNILLLFFEDLKQNPQATYDKICNFLSILPEGQDRIFEIQNSSLGKKMHSELYVKIKNNKIIYSIIKPVANLLNIKPPKRSIDNNICFPPDVEKQVKEILKGEMNQLLEYAHKPTDYW